MEYGNCSQTAKQFDHSLKVQSPSREIGSLYKEYLFIDVRISLTETGLFLKKSVIRMFAIQSKSFSCPLFRLLSFFPVWIFGIFGLFGL